jgi:hypothetical protein
LYSISDKFVSDGPFMTKPAGFMYGVKATQAALGGTVPQVFKTFPPLATIFRLGRSIRKRLAKLDPTILKSLETTALSWLMG